MDAAPIFTDQAWCPECGAAPGEYCRGRRAQEFHEARKDRARLGILASLTSVRTPIPAVRPAPTPAQPSKPKPPKEQRRAEARAAGRNGEQPSAAQRTRERAGDQCELRIEGVCDGKNLQVHHVLPQSAGGRNGLGNLRLACARCHRYAHDNTQWATRVGHLRGIDPMGPA